MEALGSSAPAVFALRARITDFHPKDVARACIPLPPPSGAAFSPMRRLRSALGGQQQGQGQGQEQEQQQWTFFFSIRLEDETGALDAVVCGGGGDFFFNQKPVRKACDLSRPENEATRREVRTVLDKRVEQREHYDLLVQSCLVRVRGPEGEEGRQVKRFRILAVPDVRGGQQRGDVGPE